MGGCVKLTKKPQTNSAASEAQIHNFKSIEPFKQSSQFQNVLKTKVIGPWREAHAPYKLLNGQTQMHQQYQRKGPLGPWAVRFAHALLHSPIMLGRSPNVESDE